MSRLRHPNVLQLLGVCISLPILCIVTEYMEQGSLFDILKQKRRLLRNSSNSNGHSQRQPAVDPHAVDGVARIIAQHYGKEDSDHPAETLTDQSTGDQSAPTAAPPAAPGTVLAEVARLRTSGVHSINDNSAPPEEVENGQPLPWRAAVKVCEWLSACLLVTIFLHLVVFAVGAVGWGRLFSLLR